MKIISNKKQALKLSLLLTTVTKVFVSIERQLIDEKYPLGGEGLILHQPISRNQFEAYFRLNK